MYRSKCIARMNTLLCLCSSDRRRIYQCLLLSIHVSPRISSVMGTTNYSPCCEDRCMRRICQSIYTTLQHQHHGFNSCCALQNSPRRGSAHRTRIRSRCPVLQQSCVVCVLWLTSGIAHLVLPTCHR